VQLQQRIGAAVLLTTSALYSRIADLVSPSDPDLTHAGVYLGWTVAVIESPVNEGDATMYGGTVGVQVHRSFGPRRQIDGHIDVSVADGRIWDLTIDKRLPVGGMSPLGVRAGIDLDWDHWSVAPRMSVVGTQRLVAFDPRTLARYTLPGYATVDVSIRRRVFSHLNAFLTVENAFDRRYLDINPGAYTDPEQLVGAPQNPRRIAIGADLRLSR
jgi:outer membrane receptor protein involved in Fe transport